MRNKTIIMIIISILIGIFLLTIGIYKIRNNNNYEDTTNNKTKLVIGTDETKDLSEGELASISKTKQINSSKSIFFNDDIIEKDITYSKQYYKDLEYFISYIKSEFNIDVNSKWKFRIHFYHEKSSGFVYFRYCINDEIETNKGFMFTISNNKIKEVNYYYLDEKVDESKILNRINKFKRNTIQEKPVLKSNEKIKNENTRYLYYCHNSKIVYEYVMDVTDSFVEDSYVSIYLVD